MSYSHLSPSLGGLLEVLGLSTGVLEKPHETTGLLVKHTRDHRVTGKMHMRGYFSVTPGRAKFRWWYGNQKRLGTTAIEH